MLLLTPALMAVPCCWVDKYPDGRGIAEGEYKTKAARLHRFLLSLRLYRNGRVQNSYGIGLR